MKSIRVLAVTLSLGVLMSVWSASAAAYSGNELLSDCRQGDEDGSVSNLAFGKCFGFINGVIFAHSGFMLQAFCLPSSGTYGQFRDMFYNFTTRHPQYRHLNAADLVSLSLFDAFPPKIRFRESDLFRELYFDGSQAVVTCGKNHWPVESMWMWLYSLGESVQEAYQSYLDDLIMADIADD